MAGRAGRGFAAVTEPGARLLRGIERADSIGVDPHKWLFQPYDAGCLLVRDVRTLERAFAIHHDVLQDSVWGANHPNQANRGLQLSRRDRALKIWMSVQIFGMAAFRSAVTRGIELAERAARYVADSPILELMTPASLGIVCFRVNPDGGAARRESAPPAQPEGPRPGVLGRACVHVVDAAPQAVRAPAVRHQPLDDLGGRPRDPGDHRALWKRSGLTPSDAI